jgi:hypothetical protein
MENNLAILVISCDKFEYVWDLFYFYFVGMLEMLKFKGNVYFISDTLKIRYDRFINLNGGAEFKGKKNEWSSAVLACIDDVKEEHIFMLLDDMVFFKRMSNDNFMTLYKYFVDNDLDKLAFRNINSNWPLLNPNVISTIGDLNIKEEIIGGSSYLINAQPSFWKTKYFKSYLIPHESPVEFEETGTIRYKQRVSNGEILKHQYIEHVGYYHHMVCEGRVGESCKQMMSDINNVVKLHDGCICRFIGSNGFIDYFESNDNNELAVKFKNRELTDQEKKIFFSCRLEIGLFYDRFSNNQKFRLSFYAKNSTNAQTCGLKIYTGSTWVTLNQQLESEYAQFVLESDFVLNDSKSIGIGFTSFVADQTILIKNITLDAI